MPALDLCKLPRDFVPSADDVGPSSGNDFSTLVRMDLQILRTMTSSSNWDKVGFGSFFFNFWQQ